jgi:hypothetical protein
MQLCDYLQCFGVPNASRRKLSANDGRSFMTAAFLVAYSLEFHDKLSDRSNWPQEIEQRKWVFQKKNG